MAALQWLATRGWYSANADQVDVSPSTDLRGSAERLPCQTIDEVFAAIEEGLATVGVVPLYNASSGVVSDTGVAILRRLLAARDAERDAQRDAGQEMQSDASREAGPFGVRPFGVGPRAQLCISECFPVAVEHCLVSWGTPATIRTVLSKQQALEQCRGWLGQHLPGATRLATDSSAAALSELSGRPEQAAIVSRLAAQQMLGAWVVEGIQDQRDNVTEFAVVQLDARSKPAVPPASSVQRPRTAHETGGSIAQADVPWYEFVMVAASTTGSTMAPVATSVAAPSGLGAGLLDLSEWVGELQYQGASYRLCKRRMPVGLSSSQPWTAAQPGPPRQWRLGASTADMVAPDP